MLRSEGDIIFAANAARDLTNLVISYLTLYKKYAQGMNGVFVPDGHYTVVILPQNQEGKLHVKLVFEEVVSHDEPVYCDNGGYEESEFGSFGSRDSISHYETRYTTQTVDKGLLIPIPLLLQSKEDMESGIKAFADGKRKELLEKERQSKIARHKEAIRQLEEQSK